MESRLGKGDLPVLRLQRTCFLVLRRVRFAGRGTGRASRFLKMFGMLKRQMLVERAAEHPAGLMTKMFDLGERRMVNGVKA